jgi:L-xylulokinase
MTQYLMGIDNGGSEIKCVLFDDEGNQIAAARRRVAMLMPAPGFTERNADDVWQANADSIREAITRAGISPQQIAAIGLTGYGNGICLVDAFGKSTYPCIVSTDSRASSYCREFRLSGAERAIYPLTLQTTWSAQPAALLAWFRDNRPEVLVSSAYCLGIKDLIRFHLTGEFSTEITEASSTCLLNLHTRTFDPEIFKTLGINEYFQLMPPCQESTAISGKVTELAAEQTGLRPGTPVVAGYFDIDAAALASGVLDESMLCLVAGTWSINEHLSKTANTDYGCNANTVTLSYLPDHFLVEDSSATSASNFDWFVEQLLKPVYTNLSRKELYQLCDRLVSETDPQSSQVVFIPYLFDSSTTSGAKAAFFNLSSQHTILDLLLAVYEGVVFSSALHIQRLSPPLGAFQKARLSGGVANSSVWAQMMADVIQIPVEVLQNNELSAQGAAMAAGIGVGLFENHQNAVQKMVKIGRVFTPDPSRAVTYSQKFAAFEKALKALEIFYS